MMLDLNGTQRACYGFFPMHAIPIRRALTARLTTAMMIPSTCEKRKPGTKVSLGRLTLNRSFGCLSDASLPVCLLWRTISEQAIGAC